MTYKESYLACDSEEEILEKVKHDVNIALLMGSNDRVKVIKQHAEEALAEKFPIKVGDTE